MAGKPTVLKFVNNVNLAATAISTTQPSPNILQQGFPVGDTIINYVHLRLYGSLSITVANGGAVVTRGGLQFLRSIRLETPKHSTLLDGWDGIMLHQAQTIENEQRPVAVDAASNLIGTPTFEYALKIPFTTPRSARPEDTGLDMYTCPNMTLTTTPGVNTDLMATGAGSTHTVNAYNQETFVEQVPGAIDPVKEGPILQSYWGIRKEVISATATQYQIILPYNDRIYRKIFVTQRNSSTFAELANTVIGASNGDRVSLKLNGYPFVDQIQWIALQDMNANDYGLSAMPTGVAVLDFTPRRATGWSYAESLNTISNIPGILELDVDVTTVANGQLWLGYLCAKPINPSALRPAAAQPR